MTLKIISGKYKGKKLKTPPEKTTRPTQSMLREAVFNICQNEIIGANFLDLFAGSGAIGLEALSRGAASATFVEQNRMAAKVILENISELHVEEQARVLLLNAEKGIEKLEKEGLLFDLIYIDPPYHVDFSLKNILNIATPSSLIFLEGGKKLAQKVPEELFLQSERTFGAAHLALFTFRA